MTSEPQGFLDYLAALLREWYDGYYSGDAQAMIEDFERQGYRIIQAEQDE